MSFPEDVVKAMVDLDCSVRFTSSAQTYKDNPQGIGAAVIDVEKPTRCNRCHVVDNTTKEEYHVEVDPTAALPEVDLVRRAIEHARTKPKPLTQSQKATRAEVEASVQRNTEALQRENAELKARLAAMSRGGRKAQVGSLED